MTAPTRLPTPAQRAAVNALVWRARALGLTARQLDDQLERFADAARLPVGTVRAAARQVPCDDVPMVRHDPHP